MAASHDSDHPVVLTKEEARSGETSGHVRTVLSTSLILTIIALAAVLGWFFLFR